jgi:hypothetical protein
VRRGDVWTEEDIPVEMIPGSAMFPTFPPPGGLVGRPEADVVVTVGGVSITAVRSRDTQAEVARRAGVDEIELPMTSNPPVFMRLLAKIGWGYAVGWLGLDTLMPGVIGVILGTDPNVAGWVGSPPPAWAAFEGPTDQTYAIRVREDPSGVVTAHLRLFAAQGGPEYLVIIGSRRFCTRWCELPGVQASLPDGAIVQDHGPEPLTPPLRRVLGIDDGREH